MRDLQINKQVVRDTRLQGPGSVFTKRYKQLIPQVQYLNAIKISNLTAQERRPDQATQEKANSEKLDNEDNFEYSLILVYYKYYLSERLDCT